MNDLRLSIHQTYGQIGIQTQKASLDIQQPLGEQLIEQPPAKMEIRQPPGELIVDSSDAWTALGSGPHIRWMNSIYSQMPGVIMQNIAKIVEDGNRMAEITNKVDAFADIAGQIIPISSPIQYVGEASGLNVKMEYKARAPIIQVEPQQPVIRYTPRKPEVQYHPGTVDIYLQHRNSIDIRVSRYNLYQ